MLSNPDDIRQAMADRINAVFAANGVTCAVYARDVRTNSYPRVIILPDTQYITYNSSMNGSSAKRGLMQLSYLVEVKTAATEAESAQITLAKFLGSGPTQVASVPDAIESLGGSEEAPASPQLNGAVSIVNVNTCTVDTGRELTDDLGKPTGVLEFTATIQVDVYTEKV
jgi:hypothetical protein